VGGATGRYPRRCHGGRGVPLSVPPGQGGVESAGRRPDCQCGGESRGGGGGAAAVVRRQCGSGAAAVTQWRHRGVDGAEEVASVRRPPFGAAAARR